jgi:predicted MFS family arabinose efflux permease
VTSRVSYATRVRRSVLGLRDFRLLWIGQAVSTVGDQVFTYAVPIAVLNEGGSASDVGFVLGARVVAIVVFALFGGVWADRLPRRHVMMAADLFRVLIIAVLFLWPGQPSILLIATMVFLVGGGEAFFRPAETALLPDIVPVERLNQANGLVMISFRTAAIVGPGLGGITVVFFGVRAAYLITVLTFLVSFVSLYLLHEPKRRERPERRPMLREMREGLGEVRRRPWVFGALVGAALMLMLVVAPETVLLPVIGRDEFGTDSVYAASLALVSVGAVVGALWAMRHRPRHPGLTSLLLGLLFLPTLFALAFPVSAGLILVSYLLTGFGWEPWSVYWQSALQREIPAERLARVASVDWMASFAFMPLGLALTGPAVSAFGETAVLVGAAVCLVLIIGSLLLFVPGIRDFSSTPAAATRS